MKLGWRFPYERSGGDGETAAKMGRQEKGGTVRQREMGGDGKRARDRR